ncbi:Arb2 domain-containing protein [Lasiosphaeria miniovina]|uniref:Arb2 domain-containing protein n=1 Tax=Lasiosphaeria miniovina TaxID=1954250 RepID=A0AA40AJD1_9PEZI|nr:Arb2 domain-containing protein [Lasiosphaeria miniovina]KAK0716912.1 Arb2 domain-containing protein [Lasiosphaeria miniovina]
MFRRRWSGLPADPQFEPDLTELGYFVNDVDEIRSLEDPDYYAKFFFTKNERWNERQRFALNDAIGRIIKDRLAAEGLETVKLPLGQTDPSKPHIPICVSANLNMSSRVVLILGESVQEFGVLAHRVVGGSGGINKGSVVDFVKGLKTQKSSAADASAPGIIIANTGELFWWPEGHRGLTPRGRHAIPMASAVHYGRYFDPSKNTIPGQPTAAEHVRYIFDKVIPALVPKNAKVDVIAVGDAADHAEQYLDNEGKWAELGRRLNCLVNLGGYYDAARFKCEGFKAFMKHRARAYVIDDAPLDTPVASPDSNLEITGSVAYGCPAYSAGPKAKLSELLLIEAKQAVLEFIQEVALAGSDYVNPTFTIISRGGDSDDEDTWAVGGGDEGGEGGGAAGVAPGEED